MYKNGFTIQNVSIKSVLSVISGVINSIFTIQNVSIKCTLDKAFKVSGTYLQYKMFLLNINKIENFK